MSEWEHPELREEVPSTAVGNHHRVRSHTTIDTDFRRKRKFFYLPVKSDNARKTLPLVADFLTLQYFALDSSNRPLIQG